MKVIEPFPVRRIAAISAAVLCSYLSVASHYHQIAQQDASGFGWGAPPPPVESFVEAALAIPGALAVLPIIVIGALAEDDLVTSGGIVLGAAFFWYCVGWYVDRDRTTLSTEDPPRIVVGYIQALRIASAILFPLGILAGLRVGNHFCANGVPPYWSELLNYGIFMSWVTLGTFFAWRRFRARWEQNHPAVRLRIWP